MAKLNIYYRDRIIGKIFTDPTFGIRFKYTDDASFPLSLSLPLSDKIYSQKELEPFFSGLLPDGEMRERIAKNAHVSSTSFFKLLSYYGRDIAGAFEILNEDEAPSSPSSFSYIKLNEETISKRLEECDVVPLLSWGGEARMSLAGAQDKIALFQNGDELYLPILGAPSNVILKAGNNDYAINEYVTTKLASFMGLEVPEITIRNYNGRIAFISKRFDRLEENGQVFRLHQEDMCQALSILPEKKYEEDGGPSIKKISSLLLDKTKLPLSSLKEFAKATVFNYLIGNCDAHGKNFSLLYTLPSSSPRLAPLYDLTSTTIYPSLSRNMAMKIGKEKRIDKIEREDIISSGIVGRKEMEIILDELITLLFTAFSKAEETLNPIAHKTLEVIKNDVFKRVSKLK